MLLGRFFVRQEQDISIIEEKLKKMCQTLDIDPIKRAKMIKRLREVILQLKDDFFSEVELQFDLVEKNKITGLTILCKISQSSFDNFEDAGILIEEYRDNEGSISPSDLHKIQKEFDQISEESLVDLLRSFRRPS